MRFFKRTNLKENKNVREIVNKTITKKYNISDDICNLTIEDAKFGVIEGNEVMLDKPLIDNMIEEVLQVIKRNKSKYNTIPKKITISHKDIEENRRRKEENCADNHKEDCLDIYSPRWDLEDVYLEEQSKKQILTSLTISKYKDKLFNEWRINKGLNVGRAVALNFWGPPGTGKSMAAEAIASYLGNSVYCVNYAELESKYVGETPKNIKKAFQRASENNSVLIFDEADSFLGKRLTNVSQSADYGVNITRSVMLMELEKFNGVVIFTTNLINNYDEAFKRRILANVEFKLPDKNGRKEIWKVHIPKELPLKKEVTFDLLCEKYEKVSGADIKDIILYASVSCLEKGNSKLEIQDFDDAYKYVMSRYKSSEDITVNSKVITKEQYEEEMKEIDQGYS